MLFSFPVRSLCFQGCSKRWKKKKHICTINWTLKMDLHCKTITKLNSIISLSLVEQRQRELDSVLRWFYKTITKIFFISWLSLIWTSISHSFLNIEVSSAWRCQSQELKLRYRLQNWLLNASKACVQNDLINKWIISLSKCASLLWMFCWISIPVN